MSWIDRLNDGASTWGEALFRASWQGALLAAVAWIVCRFWKRIPPRVHCAVWLLVCLKMLIGLFPVALDLPLLPAEKAVETTSASSLPDLSYTIPSSFMDALVAAPTLSTGSYVLIAWLLGIAVVLSSVAFALSRVRKHLRQAHAITDPEALRAIRELADKIGLRCAPKLLQTEAEVGVLTIGALRPIILISKSTLDRCTPEELRLVLAHELAHIKRGDAWLALLPQLVGALFFFHPAAWLVSKEFELAREAACDEIAMRSLDARSDVFGRLLLKLSSRRELAASFFVLGISSHFKVLSRRISMLNRNSSGPRRLGRQFAAVAVIGALCVTPWSLVRAQAPQPAPVKLPVQTKKAKPTPTKLAQAAKPKAPVKTAQDKKTKLKKAGPATVVLQLKYTLASDIQKALSKKPRDKDVKIVAEPQRNLLVISGPFVKTKSIIDEAKALDKKVSSKSDLAVQSEDKVSGWIIYRTGTKNAEAMAQKFMEQIRKQNKTRKVSMIADPSSKRIMLRGEADAVKQTIADLDAIKAEDLLNLKPLERRSMHQVPIMFQSVTEIAKILNDEFGSKYSRSDLIILSDQATNTLILDAKSEAAAEVKARVSILDQRPVNPNPAQGARVIRRFPVKTMDVTLAFAKFRERLPKDTTVDFCSYDPTDNSLVIRCAETEMEAIRKLVESIDQKG